MVGFVVGKGAVLVLGWSEECFFRDSGLGGKCDVPIAFDFRAIVGGKFLFNMSSDQCFIDVLNRQLCNNAARDYRHGKDTHTWIGQE